MDESEDNLDEDVKTDEASDEQVFSNPLTEEYIPSTLSALSKVGYGLQYAYIRFTAKEMKLTDIKLLSKYTHLRYVDISENLINDLSPICALTFLLWLKADHNHLNQCLPNQMNHLQLADFSSNKIIIPDGIYHPQLETLNLSKNQISSMPRLNANRLCNLHILEIRGNQLESTSNLALPSLTQLYLAQNGLTCLTDLAALENLVLLHLRDNNIEHLNGFNIRNKKLEYINLRNNKILTISEINKLRCLPSLKTLVLLENPIGGEDEASTSDSYRIPVLARLYHLKRLDKTDFTVDEKQQARKVARVLDKARQAKKVAAKSEATAAADEVALPAMSTSPVIDIGDDYSHEDDNGDAYHDMDNVDDSNVVGNDNYDEENTIARRGKRLSTDSRVLPADESGA